MATELKGQALLDYYRDALRACFGDFNADRADLSCGHGWYHINGIRPFRAARVRKMADNLLRRAEEYYQ